MNNEPEKSIESEFPDDLQNAITNLLQLALKHKVSVVGMMMQVNPPKVCVLSNVREKGSDLAELFREYGDMISEAYQDNRVTNQTLHRPI